VLETPFESIYGGSFRMLVFRNTLDRTEHLALVRGRIEPDKPTLVRMHKVDIASDMLGHVDSRRDYIPAALKAISAHDGAGVAVFIRDPSPSWLSERYGHEPQDPTQTALRDYGVGAQILLDLGVHDMILLSSSPVRLAAAEGYGLKIVDRIPLKSPE
jgi:3,4-dihydroxy 2-butanone 4-phosphate synthase/GTP cyclohydrolase II